MNEEHGTWVVGTNIIFFFFNRLEIFVFVFFHSLNDFFLRVEFNAISRFASLLEEEF